MPGSDSETTKTLSCLSSIDLVTEVVPNGQALERAQELAREIAKLPQGAIRSDKESVMRGVGRNLEPEWPNHGL